MYKLGWNLLTQVSSHFLHCQMISRRTNICWYTGSNLSPHLMDVHLATICMDEGRRSQTSFSPTVWSDCDQTLACLIDEICWPWRLPIFFTTRWFPEGPTFVDTLALTCLLTSWMCTWQQFAWMRAEEAKPLSVQLFVQIVIRHLLACSLCKMIIGRQLVFWFIVHK